MSNSEHVTFEIEGSQHDFPVITGSEGEKAIDIGKLRATTGYVTIDPAFVNTASCTSDITFLDGEKGILHYRGYPIEQLAEKSTFLETSYLLIYGELPSTEQLANFTDTITRHSIIHEDLKAMFDSYPTGAHPMATLSSMITTLSAFYPEMSDTDQTPEQINLSIARLIAKVTTLTAYSYKKSIGQPLLYPDNRLDYCADFLRMMFGVPSEEFEVDEDIVQALNLLLILHADHEQNCSTSTVRLAGSSRTNMFAAISAGALALWGPLHGGANQAVLEMLQTINEAGGDYKQFLAKAKDPDDSFRLMGFGHRVYKNFDPRAKIIKVACDKVLAKLGVHDPLLDIAKGLEEVALEDEYFVERKLYPNVDFYSGIIYHALGIPTNMFTVMFAIGRLPGWIAQWKEMLDQDSKIGRPRQIYTGAVPRPYSPIEQR
ncbi:MAG: citrate synthase [Immundisolibacteraceae bacterium]|jgi:citrate synthase|nr:citrate synthase [Immundisolibacteraceae bacterium]